MDGILDVITAEYSEQLIHLNTGGILLLLHAVCTDDQKEYKRSLFIMYICLLFCKSEDCLIMLLRWPFAVQIASHFFCSTRTVDRCE